MRRPSVAEGASNAAPRWRVDWFAASSRVEPRSDPRWRRSATSVAMMIALLQIARAGAAEVPPASFKPPRLVHFVEAVLPTAPAARREAEVVLSLDVDVTGKVCAVEVA